MKKLALCITLLVALMGMVIPSFAQETPSYVDILSVLSTVSEAYPEGIIVEASLEETTTPVCWLVQVLVADSEDDGMLEEEDITVCVDALTGVIATEWSFVEDEDDDVDVDDVDVDNEEEDLSEDDDPIEDDSDDDSDDEFSMPVMSMYEAIEAARVIYPNGVLVYVSVEEEDGAYVWYLVFADSAGVVVEDADGTVLDYGYDIEDWDESDDSDEDYSDDESDDSDEDYSGDESDDSDEDYSDDESDDSDEDYSDDESDENESDDDESDEDESDDDESDEDESDDDESDEDESDDNN